MSVLCSLEYLIFATDIEKMLSSEAAASAKQMIFEMELAAIPIFETELAAIPIFEMELAAKVK